MSPYMHSVLIALIPHLKAHRSNIEVNVHVLNAISELSLIGGLEIVSAVDKLFPPIIAFLQDSTSLNRREVRELLLNKLHFVEILGSTSGNGTTLPMRRLRCGTVQRCENFFINF